MHKYIWVVIIVLTLSLFSGLAPSSAYAQAAGSVSITSPNGGETLTVGQTYRITWNASSNIDTVYLGYSAGPGSLDWIATSIPNTGYYDWIVNVGNTTNTQFKIDVTAYATGVGSWTDQSDNFFTVINPASQYQICETCVSLDKDTYYVGDTPRIVMGGLPANTQIYWTFYQDGKIVEGPNADFGDVTNGSGYFADYLNILEDRYIGDWVVIVKVGYVIGGAEYAVHPKIIPTPVPTPPTPVPSIALAHPEGTNILGPDGTVYFINTGSTRSPYTSAGAFLSFKFNSWATVVAATSADMALPLTTYTPTGG